MTFPYDAVIFDMDGLLVDSERVWETCETALLSARGKTYDVALQRSLVGMRMDDYLTAMINGYGLSDTIETLHSEVMTRMVALVPTDALPHKGAVELLDYLQAQTVPCAIASSSGLDLIDVITSSHNLARYFKLMVSGEEVARGKPAPDVYLEAARRLGVDPRRCLALEDSVNGTRAAVAAGMTCFAVPDPHHSKPEAFAGITPHVYPSLLDVLRHLEQQTAA